MVKEAQCLGQLYRASEGAEKQERKGLTFNFRDLGCSLASHLLPIFGFYDPKSPFRVARLQIEGGWVWSCNRRFLSESQLGAETLQGNQKNQSGPTAACFIAWRTVPGIEDRLFHQIVM